MLLAGVFVVALALVCLRRCEQPTASRSSAPALTLSQAKPSPEIVALRGAVRLQLPIAQARVTAIGYRAARDGALSLSPVGHQANEGVVARVVHGIFGGGGGTRSGTSSAAAARTRSTSAHRPGGTSTRRSTGRRRDPAVHRQGKQYGAEIDIQPQSAPSLVVAVTQLAADPALTVGSAVVAARRSSARSPTSRSVEQQALAHYTNDGGTT